MPTVKPPKINHSRLLPVSPVVTKLLKFFSHHWDFILKREGESWYTETRYRLNPRNFESYWQDPKISLGLRFAGQTKFGCLDLDENSANNPLVNPKRYRKLLQTLRKIGIKETVLIRSSSNRGVHLFFFLPLGINSFNLACALFRVLSENCFAIKSGELEIFPNTKRYKKKGEGFSLFNGLRVPMQPGSGATLLDPKTFEPVPGGAEKFVELMNSSGDRQDFKLLKECCNTARDWYCNFALNKQGRAQWQKDIEYSLKFGFTGSGQTNDILKNLANLGRVFYGSNTVSALAKFIHERVIDLPGYIDHCGHQDEIEKRAFEWATSAINYWSAWASTPQRKQNFTELWTLQEQLSGVEPEVKAAHRGRWGWVNQKRSDETMSRLKTILAEYPLDTMPKGVLKRVDFINERCHVMFGTKFSRNTLKKLEYRTLWHPKYTQEVVTQKEPGFSFKLAMGCLSAIAQKIFVTIKLLINSEKKHITEKQQSKKEASKAIQKAIAPPTCSTLQNASSKIPETQAIQEFSQSDRTLVKCCVGLTPYLVYRVFVLKLELIKQDIKQKLDNLFTLEIKTSETKLKEIGKARRKNSYFYHGLEVSSRSASNRREDELINLKSGMKVRILTDIHSSSLGDDCRQIMVYVKLIKVESKEKSPEKYLVPLNTLIYATSTDSYINLILPQIKGLVDALGLTKEDYLQYIEQIYGVKRTGQLRSTKIFEVVTHFQNLFYSVFDKSVTV
ncbi:hypothetical protein C7B62_16600 [Pleurocapsa sp. CCALA 161]|uniref:hypothetical protein n=1 Tax=Pleurocapsa sp. CCALA 161 TaxID=2107688 RepID=UPI000D06132B|nr:hypothetical protein [Pleurocapsa sp. CCALA 161]PSB08462.1 hypothetical protein C7B62_16600 [Pleurocapsa sp. CCALA 161]